MSLAQGYGYPKKVIVVVQMSFSLALIDMGLKLPAASCKECARYCGSMKRKGRGTFLTVG